MTLEPRQRPRMTTDPPAADQSIMGPEPEPAAAEADGPPTPPAAESGSDGGAAVDGAEVDGAGVDGAGALGDVVNDLDARRESEDWALEQMEKGRTPEEVEAALVADGWSQDDAAEMAEHARKETRHLRGVVTREEISRGAEANYRTTFRRLPLVMIFGIPILFSNLLRSIAGVRKLKQMTEHDEADGDNGDPPERPAGG